MMHGNTTTTTTITETHVQTNIRFDPNYVKTIQGALKVAAVVLNLIVFICGVSASTYWRNKPTLEWAFFVSMTAFWVTGILLIMYVLHVIEKFHVIPWLLIEMIFCGAWSLFYFSTGIDCAVRANEYNVPALTATSVFSFIALIVYAYDTFLKYSGWRAGQLAQGERRVQQTQSSQKEVI